MFSWWQICFSPWAEWTEIASVSFPNVSVLVTNSDRFKWKVSVPGRIHGTYCSHPRSLSNISIQWEWQVNERQKWESNLCPSANAWTQAQHTTFWPHSWHYGMCEHVFSLYKHRADVSTVCKTIIKTYHGWPSCLQITLASSSVNPSSQTLPHCPFLFISTRPSFSLWPFLRRMIISAI